MSLAGFWAGMGDAARADNARREKEATARRDAFAEDLGRIMESAEWPEEARVTAGQMRQRLFSDTKIKPKDYEKMWLAVKDASGRPGAPSAELAAARSDVPAMQSLSKTMSGTSGVPEAQPDGLTMRPSGPVAPLDLLRPAEPSTVDGTSTFMNLRPAGTPEPSLVNPPSMAQAANTRLSQAQNTIATTPPPPMVYGPRTRAEKNTEAMEMFQQQQRAHLDTYGKQKEIDAQYAKPVKTLQWDSKRGIFVNEATGDIEIPENLPETEQDITEGPPEQQFIASALGEAASRGLNIKDPAVRNRVIASAHKQWAELGRNPDIDAMRDMQFAAMQNERLARFDRDQRDYQLQASTKVRALYEEDIKGAKLSMPYAVGIRRAATNPSRGSDFYMLYKIVSGVDPKSVVREGELLLLQSLMSHWANAERSLNKITGSDKALADEARRLALVVADHLEQDGKIILNQAQKRAESLAQRHGVDPGLIGIIQYDGRGNLPPVEYPPWQMPQPKRPNYSANGAHITSSDASEATRPPGAFLRGLTDVLRDDQ